MNQRNSITTLEQIEIDIVSGGVLRGQAFYEFAFVTAALTILSDISKSFAEVYLLSGSALSICKGLMGARLVAGSFCLYCCWNDPIGLLVMVTFGEFIFFWCGACWACFGIHVSRAYFQ